MNDHEQTKLTAAAAQTRTERPRRKKLALHCESIRLLSAEELGSVAGGKAATITRCGWGC